MDQYKILGMFTRIHYLKPLTVHKSAGNFVILSFRVIMKFQAYGPDYCCTGAAPAMWLTALQVANIMHEGKLCVILLVIFIHQY